MWTIFKQVKRALDEEDIEGLLALECPPDEYDGEASEIEDAVAKASAFGKNSLQPEQLEEIVRNIWVRSFGPMGEEQVLRRKPAFQRVAEKLSRELSSGN